MHRFFIVCRIVRLLRLFYFSCSQSAIRDLSQKKRGFQKTAVQRLQQNPVDFTLTNFPALPVRFNFSSQLDLLFSPPIFSVVQNSPNILKNSFFKISLFVRVLILFFLVSRFTFQHNFLFSQNVW
jgi:hypothetical protein